MEETGTKLRPGVTTGNPLTRQSIEIEQISLILVFGLFLLARLGD